MAPFKIIILICFVNGVCRANSIMYFKISKNEVIPFKNELIITPKEVAVEIMVDEILHPESHDVVTLDQLICYNNGSNHMIFSNLNFIYVTTYLSTNYTQHRYKSIQELKILGGSNGEWQWLCKLYAQWNGRNVVYEFEVKVEMLEKNESTSKDTHEKNPLLEHQVPSKTKQLIKNGPKNIKHVNKTTSDLNDEIGEAKNNPESTENKFSNKTLAIVKEKQPTEPKSFSSGNTGQTSRNQKGKNHKPTEKNDGKDLVIGVKLANTLNNVNGSSTVANDETSKTINWVIFFVASAIIFIVGLVTGAICRRPPTTASSPEPEPTEQTDDQRDEHIYEEVNFEVDKSIQNRPPLPVPEKEVQIYNSPYDHTLWFQNQSALN